MSALFWGSSAIRAATLLIARRLVLDSMEYLAYMGKADQQFLDDHATDPV